jgi:hypothetical protein
MRDLAERTIKQRRRHPRYFPVRGVIEANDSAD